MENNWKIISAGVGILIVILGGTWFFFFRTSPSSTSSTSDTISFGIGDDRTVTVPPTTEEEGNVVTTSTSNQQKIFKVADGPVTGATLIQTLHPTTTIARYTLQQNGHVLDLVLDNPGSIARAVSNTTIPGTVHTVWVEKGNGVIIQYLDSEVVKSVYLGFPSTPTTTATTSNTRPVRIQFFPDSVASLAASPDGKSVVYLLKTTSGTDGYIAKSDSTGSKKLFSVLLSETLISWPAQNTMLLQTKSGVGLPGVLFSVNAQSGAVTSLVYGPGLTATSDSSFSAVMYQTAGAATAPNTYLRNIKSGTNSTLSFDPIPEKCVWGSMAASFYCAASTQYRPPNYLDLWHQGVASVPDTLFSFDMEGRSKILGVPGGVDGGVASDIAELAVSPDEKYLLFVKKGDRSLWALRLTP